MSTAPVSGIAAVYSPPHSRGLHRQKARRALVRQIYAWHWISSAVCLAGMLLFAVTGVTLNHAADITAEPTVTEIEGTLPPEILAGTARMPQNGEAPLSPAIRDWLRDSLSIAATERAAEWSENEVYLAMPRPGGDAWLSIERSTGQVLYEHTDRGWVSYLNDLHKGRNTGTAWSWFIDVFAGEAGRFRLLLDGRPATGVDVEIVRGGTRYRDDVETIHARTDAEGAFEVIWPEPGMYWLNASVDDAGSTVRGAERRTASYTATLEVLPQ